MPNAPTLQMPTVATARSNPQPIQPKLRQMARLPQKCPKHPRYQRSVGGRPLSTVSPVSAKADRNGGLAAGRGAGVRSAKPSWCGEGAGWRGPALWCRVEGSPMASTPFPPDNGEYDYASKLASLRLHDMERLDQQQIDEFPGDSPEVSTPVPPNDGVNGHACVDERPLERCGARCLGASRWRRRGLAPGSPCHCTCRRLAESRFIARR